MSRGTGEDLTGVTIRAGLRLDGMIARGGFGTVYRGRQLDVERDVAVKVLHAGFDPAAEAARLFRDEIRAIGAIDHRNVVRIYDAGTTPDGRLYFLMELLPGQTLAELATRGPLPAPRAIGLAGQVLSGLAAVHAAGRIHADVKPANVVVVPAADGERAVLIDFGLTRLRPATGATDAVGGTRAYMAPEQLRHWQLGERSDVFSAALVVVRLLTGWERSSADEVVPALDGIADPVVRRALERALEIDVDARPSAQDLEHALVGGPPAVPVPAGPPPPFRHLTPLTERDRGRLYGRAADIAALAAQLGAGRIVALIAPSGVGKTSLLRAGLIPYLDASGHTHSYLACRPGAPTAAAVDERQVVILDQLETLATSLDAVELTRLLDRACALADTAVVLGIREDFAARIIGGHPALARGVPMIRLRPLDRVGARAALTEPLREHGVEIEPALLASLLDDLARAGDEIGASFGWTATGVVYPPHLQLVGETLWRALEPGAATVTLAHYHRAGGLDTVIGEELDRKLAELSTDDRALARELFVQLVTVAHARAFRPEAELFALLGARDSGEVRRVLGRLEAYRLVVRHAGVDGTPAWAVIHDSLIPRIEAWLTVHDLERRRIAEALRYHVRQSEAGAPVVMPARLLRAVDRLPGLLDELDREWVRRPAAVWTPRRLVARSRSLLRYRRALAAAATVAVAALVGLLAFRWLEERARRAAEVTSRDRDLGRIELSITAFDLQRDPATGAAVAVPVPAGELPALTWNLHEPDPDDPDAPGAVIDPGRIRRGARVVAGQARLETGLEVRGGDAFLVATGRGRRGDACGASVLPLRRLPGYARRATVQRLAIAVPTCEATRFDTIEVPAGPFVHGGAGDPPLGSEFGELRPEAVIELDGFRIDRTEITNAAYAVFAALDAVSGVWPSTYPSELAAAAGPMFPRVDLDWFDARAYCRYLGKELPTSAQWQKAMRGGIDLASGPNPAPRRNLPWGTPETASRAALAVARLALPSPVGSHRDDASPYGVLDLAGNAQEWTADVEDAADDRAPLARRPRVARGGNWAATTPDDLVIYMVSENPRSPRFRTFYLGARCATQLDQSAASAARSASR
jgi:eukaryotic-like serine/threonine-protein kinase